MAISKQEQFRSWRGYVTASRGTALLGGTTHHESSRFATLEDAQAWVSVIVRTNCEAHRIPSAWGTEASTLAPEIQASL